MKNLNFWGIPFYRIFNGEIVLVVHPKSIKRFTDKIKTILKRNRGISINRYILELNQVTIGWVNYFYLGLFKNTINKLDKWIRHKIRAILWKQWKTSKNRKRMFNKYIIKKWKKVNSSRGIFNVAGKQLHFSLRNYILENEYGFKPCIESYYKILEKRKDMTSIAISL